MSTPEGPAALIETSGRTLRQIAEAAGLDVKTVLVAKQRDAWPAQKRTSSALRAVLAPPAPVDDALPQAEAC